ncbi:hypothetical protein K1719_013754 [Acacia pycnantha]|nr:hypothetical protein K1719_013754 [Acacia pycnantha]
MTSNGNNLPSLVTETSYQQHSTFSSLLTSRASPNYRNEDGRGIRSVIPLRPELLRVLGGAEACPSLLGVPLGHNSSFLQGPAFAPPRIREAIWCGSTNSTTEEGKHELRDPRVLTDVGDVPVQEIRDCGVDDDRLMNVISESVKLVMEECWAIHYRSNARNEYHYGLLRKTATACSAANSTC